MESVGVGVEVLAPLAEVLRQGSLEQRTRAVEIVGRIYGRGDAASFYDAEQILDQVARDAKGSLVVSARTTLETNYLVRQRLDRRWLAPHARDRNRRELDLGHQRIAGAQTVSESTDDWVRPARPMRLHQPTHPVRPETSLCALLLQMRRRQ